jgi:hypothetical protein
MRGTAQKTKRELKRAEGKVMSILAQRPTSVSANVGGNNVRFCNPADGRNIIIDADNIQYDMLRAALLAGKDVKVGYYDLGHDASNDMAKLCIDRVILQQ